MIPKVIRLLVFLTVGAGSIFVGPLLAKGISPPANTTRQKTTKNKNYSNENSNKASSPKTTNTNNSDSAMVSADEHMQQFLDMTEKLLQAQGKTPEEIAVIMAQAKELFKDEEFREIFEEFDADIQELVQEKQKLDAKRAELERAKGH
jgi:hypothetical protein